MGSIEVAVRYAKKIESLLVEKFGADGRGLHAKLTSVQDRIPDHIAKRIRWIATVRNNVVHNDDSDIKDVRDFEDQCNDVIAALETLAEDSGNEQTSSWGTGFGKPKPNIDLSWPESKPSWFQGNTSRERNYDTRRKMPPVKFIFFLLLLTGYLLSKVVSNDTGHVAPITAVDNSVPQNSMSPKETATRQNPPPTGQEISSKTKKHAHALNSPTKPSSQPPENNTQRITMPVTVLGEGKSAQPTRQQTHTTTHHIGADVPTTDALKDKNSDFKSSMPIDNTMLANALSSREQQNTAYKDINDMFKYIVDNLSVNVGTVEFSPDGNNYDARVLVNWHVDSSMIKDTFKKYFIFDINRDHSLFKIVKFRNQDDEQKLPYTYDLYQYLLETKLRLVVMLGNVQSRITIGSGMNCFVSCDGEGESQYHLQVTNNVDPKRLLLSGFRGEHNPVLLHNLTLDSLKKNSDIRVYVESIGKINKRHLTYMKTQDPSHTLASAKGSINSLKNAKQDIDRHIFNYIKQHTRIELGSPKFRDNGDQTYDVFINVNWNLDGRPVIKTLEKYFTVKYMNKYSSAGAPGYNQSGYNRVSVDRFANQNERQLLPYSDTLYKYLLEKQLNIVISLGDYRSKITVATGMDCFVTCNGVGDSAYQIMFSNTEDPRRLLLNRYKGQQNPVVLHRVSRKTLGEKKAIQASITFN